MACRDLGGNAFSGGLPDEWAGPTSLPKLEVLNLQANMLSGSLSAAWGGVNAFISLMVL